ncbi:hypothetical protein PoB_002288000 [Plakobranchus ocellatus]|uniref:Uncharacterized protein n=1 Tax=Plakobranchus ocellatus TaxID=259542 RepID=A0AAV3ZML7_9GAST|nr:hypothetical protein PoB_002288000 [Plakobranchus ocellatus]
MALQGSKQMKVRGCQVWTVGKMRKNFPTVALQPLLSTFLGHVMRRGNLEHLVTTGNFEGKRSKGRQREKIMDGLATWLGPGKVSDILAAVKDRDLWRDMIANAYKQGT